MTETTVRELANNLGQSEEYLLKQMSAAKLSHRLGDDIVSTEEKQHLLNFISGIVGGKKTTTASRLTLSRTVKSSNAAHNDGKNKDTKVNIIRKKRVSRKTAVIEPPLQPLSKSEENKDSSKFEDVLINAEAKRLQIIRDKQREQQAEIDRKAMAEEAATQASSAVSGKDSGKDKEEDAKKATPTELTTTKDTADSKKTLRVKSEDDAKKNPVKRRRVKFAKDDKEWHKHSHRPQDFAIDDDLDNKERRHEEGRRNRLAALSSDNKHHFRKPTAVVRKVVVKRDMSVKELARALAMKTALLISKLKKMGEEDVFIDQILDIETTTLLVEELGHEVKISTQPSIGDEVATLLSLDGSDAGEQKTRPPVVTIMGHVNHGKTSLLDYIRKTKIVDGEAGSITQHIGAYHIETKAGMITFIDTPGHASFTAMRARGVQVTDIVILVVAADDGVMPQTREAIEHVNNTDVALVVAINKIDKEGANLERIKSELMQVNVIPEDMGGDVPFVPISALTGKGVDALLEGVHLQAELLELKARRDTVARGVVIESSLDKNRGAICTLLIQQGVLKRGQIILAGKTYGNVRAITNDYGQTQLEALPSMPISVLGLRSSPKAGDRFAVVDSERKARAMIEYIQQQENARQNADVDFDADEEEIDVDAFFGVSNEEDQKKVLSIIIKTDVSGSLEAIMSEVENLGNEEVSIKVISSGVGGINETDVNFAIAKKAMIVAFNVRLDSNARVRSKEQNVNIRHYSVIYQLLEELKQSLSGMLSPTFKETMIGLAEVRETFKSPKFELIAGCMVTEGVINRNKPVRVLRDNVVVFEGQLQSLRHLKENVDKIRKGTECGIGIQGYNDVKVGDQIEVFDVEEIERQL